MWESRLSVKGTAGCSGGCARPASAPRGLTLHPRLCREGGRHLPGLWAAGRATAAPPSTFSTDLGGCHKALPVTCGILLPGQDMSRTPGQRHGGSESSSRGRSRGKGPPTAVPALPRLPVAAPRPRRASAAQPSSSPSSVLALPGAAGGLGRSVLLRSPPILWYFVVRQRDGKGWRGAGWNQGGVSCPWPRGVPAQPSPALGAVPCPPGCGSAVPGSLQAGRRGGCVGRSGAPCPRRSCPLPAADHLSFN